MNCSSSSVVAMAASTLMHMQPAVTTPAPTATPTSTPNAIPTATPSTPTPSVVVHGIPPVLEEHYRLLSLLGKGGSGYVYKARRRHDRMPCAVKMIPRHTVPTHRLAVDQTPQGQQVILPMEVYLLRRLQHPNIIALLDYFSDDQYFYVVTELHGQGLSGGSGVGIDGGDDMCSSSSSSSTSTSSSESDSSSSCSFSSSDDGDNGGASVTTEPPTTCPSKSVMDLFDCIESNGHLPEPVALSIFRQLVDATCYLQSRNVYHLDLKDENVVVVADTATAGGGNGGYRVKLIDFGSASVVGSSAIRLQHFFGTFAYAPPEILTGQTYQPERSDVWSLGVLLYTMLFGQSPYLCTADLLAGRMAPLRKPLATAAISKPCLALVASMLQHDETRRISLRDLKASADLWKEGSQGGVVIIEKNDLQ